MAPPISICPEIRRLRIISWASASVIAPEADGDDGHDEHAIHFVALDGTGRVLGASRLCVHDRVADLPDLSYFARLLSTPECLAPIGALTRLAVALDAQGNGLGSRLTRARVEYGVALGCRSLVVGVRSERIPKFGALGFISLGQATEAVVSPWKRPEDPRYVLYRKVR